MLDVEQVAVISLARRPERLAAFTAGLPTSWPWPTPDLEVAVDGEEHTPPREWKAGPGAYGCARSHLNVLHSAYDSGAKAVLVLEDDAVFTDDFAERLTQFEHHVPDHWKLLLLGGQHVTPPTTVSTGVVRCHDTQRTHAYIVRRTAMPVLIGRWQTWTNHIDRALHLVQAVVETYAPHPLLVGQAAGTSDITGGTHRERFWAS